MQSTGATEAPSMEDPKVKLFDVKNPIKQNGHIKYSVAGVDSEGPFEQ
jgi:hypothetical protein